jgi:hypothetical protein
MKAPTQYPCWDCKELLPPGGAGKCRKCAGTSGNVSSLFPAPPSCPTCKKALPNDPKGPMAWANPPHVCTQLQKEAA